MFTLAWVPRMAFKLRAHVPLESMLTSLVFDALALLPLWSLGKEIS
jgi:hypothetical protein